MLVLIILSVAFSLAFRMARSSLLGFVRKLSAFLCICQFHGMYFGLHLSKWKGENAEKYVFGVLC